MWPVGRGGAFFVERPESLADEQQVTDAQEADATTALEATTPADAQEADAQTPNDLEAARKLRREAAALRKRVDELEREKLSESERLQKDFEATAQERDELRETLRAMRAEAAVRDAGALYPDLVAARIPADALDDPKALAGVMKDLKSAYPSMFRSTNGSADGGAGQNGGAIVAPNLNDAFRALAREAT